MYSLLLKKGYLVTLYFTVYLLHMLHVLTIVITVNYASFLGSVLRILIQSPGFAN